MRSLSSPQCLEASCAAPLCMPSHRSPFRPLFACAPHVVPSDLTHSSASTPPATASQRAPLRAPTRASLPASTTPPRASSQSPAIVVSAAVHHHPPTSPTRRSPILVTCPCYLSSPPAVSPPTRLLPHRFDCLNPFAPPHPRQSTRQLPTQPHLPPNHHRITLISPTCITTITSPTSHPPHNLHLFHNSAPNQHTSLQTPTTIQHSPTSPPTHQSPHTSRRAVLRSNRSSPRVRTGNGSVTQ